MPKFSASEYGYSSENSRTLLFNSLLKYRFSLEKGR